MKHLHKVHVGVCLLLWTLWSVGIALIVVGRGDIEFFFRISDPYNRTVLLCSLIPVEPTLFVTATISAVRGKAPFQRVLLGVLFFVVTAILCLVYIVLFVSLTGGV